MLPDTDLFLYEELMLLALRDRKGTVAADDTAFTYTLAAALISELILSGHIEVDEVKRNRKVIDLRRSTRTRDPLLDECIGRLKDARRRASLETWVSRFAGIKKLKHRIALQLCKRGILRADEDKVLLIFTRKIYPELNPRPEQALIGRLREAIIAKRKNLDPRTAVMIALADTAGVLKNVFSKEDLKQHRKRIKEIASGELTAAVAKDVIAGVRTAIMVAVMVPIMVSAAHS